MSTVGREATSTTGSAVAHTAVADHVAVKSVVSTETQSKVSMENTQKMAALMSKLGKLNWAWPSWASVTMDLHLLRYNASASG